MGSTLQQWRLACGSFQSKLTSSTWTATSRGGFTSKRQERANSQWKDIGDREWILLSMVFTVLINGLVLVARIASREINQHLYTNDVKIEGGVKDEVKLITALVVLILYRRFNFQGMPRFCIFIFVSIYGAPMLNDVCFFLGASSDFARSIHLFPFNVTEGGQTISIPMSRGLVVSMLLRAGIEQNPGPVDDESCKAHVFRLKVEKKLSNKMSKTYVPSNVRDKKVFNVSVGPEMQIMSFEDIENDFEKGKEWLEMQEDVYPVPTTILKKRMKPYETLRDIEEHITTEYDEMFNIERSNLTQKQQNRMAENEKIRKQVEGQIKTKVEKEMKSNPDLNAKINFYKNRLGDEAEDLVLEGVTAALAGIPSLVINGVKFYSEFPRSLKNAGISLTSSAPNHQREMDMIVIYPWQDVLCVRFIEVKRSVHLPYEEPQKTLNKELTRKMIEQLDKNVEEYLRLFPDVHRSTLDIKIIGAVPYTSGDSAFCEDCQQKTLVQEDFNVHDSGQRIRSKLGIPKTSSPTPVQVSSNVKESYKRAAARLLGLHSLVQKDLRHVGSGPRAVAQRLDEVDKEVEEHLEEGVLFSPQQRDILLGSVESTFIWGGFGTGKTVIGVKMVEKFIQQAVMDRVSATIIVASFSVYGNCDKLVDRFRKILSVTDEDVQLKVYDRTSLLEEFQMNEEYGTKRMTKSLQTVEVLNKLLHNITEKFPENNIMIMLDEVPPYSVYLPNSYDWTNIIIPDPDRVTLVTSLQPSNIGTFDTGGEEVIPPPDDIMRPVRLARQYRSVNTINELIKFISDTVGYKLLDRPAQSGHDIPGPVPYWYSIKGKGWNRPDLDELTAVLVEIEDEMISTHDNLSGVTIICEYFDMIPNVREVAPQFPHVSSVGLFLGCESQTVVYITSCNGYSARSMDGISRAEVSLYIVTYGEGTLQETLDKAPPQLLKKRTIPCGISSSFDSNFNTGGLPPGWTVQVAPNDRVFFLNHNEKTTSWINPETETETLAPTGLPSPVIPNKRDQDTLPDQGPPTIVLYIVGSCALYLLSLVT